MPESRLPLLVSLSLLIAAMLVVCLLYWRLRRRQAAIHTQPHQEENAIRRERDRLRAMISSIEDGLFILDAGGRVTFANPAAETLVGELRLGLRGVCAQPCQGKRRGMRSCFECVSSPQPHPEIRSLAIGARIYDLRTSALEDSGERVFLSRDVTEKYHQATRQVHQERLAVLGEIAAVLAHELNNPLAAISMFSQMLLDGLDPTSPLHAHAEVIHRNMTSCKHTLRALLEMASSRGGKPALFDARDLVEDVAELLRPVAENAGVALRATGDAEQADAWGDELQLRQALVNLVMNGVQAVAGRPGAEVRIGTLDRKGELLVAVSDNGPGIPVELRERIFDPFFTTKPAGAGTGLGLSTARRMVETQGGRLVLRNAAAGAVSFEMTLPRPAHARGATSTAEAAA